MKKIPIFVTLAVFSCALVLANTESKTMQLKVLPTHSVVLVSETSLDNDGTKNIEMEIIGLNPKQKFELTFKENNCNALSSHSLSKDLSNNSSNLRSAVVTSNDEGSIIGFYSGKNGLGVGAIGIKALDDNQDICLDINV